MILWYKVICFARRLLSVFLTFFNMPRHHDDGTLYLLYYTYFHNCNSSSGTRTGLNFPEFTS
ncbi:hypothetical protein SAMN04487941_0298 [Pontibacter akesuensis]|uniref:Uncharacterized protein n=1 Tax=Pontibacter akesuensis TaxID=388950 RepID=A0A1I7FLC7_9BACT|nr:hypothetical protein SAMN04487941_0298 [Pontibacter akesuensis]